MIKKFLLAIASCCLLAPATAQTTGDKVEADSLFFASLLSAAAPLPYQPTPAFDNTQCQKTAERDVFRVVGEHFQTDGLRSDWFVRKTPKGSHEPIFSARYPMESFVNLLLGRIRTDAVIALHHRQYGHHTAELTLPLCRFYDLKAPGLNLYCCITEISEKTLTGFVVMHQPNAEVIHLLSVNTSPAALFAKGTMLEADLHTNIPQHNLKSLFNDK